MQCCTGESQAVSAPYSLKEPSSTPKASPIYKWMKIRKKVLFGGIFWSRFSLTFLFLSNNVWKQTGLASVLSDPDSLLLHGDLLPASRLAVWPNFTCKPLLRAFTHLHFFTLNGITMWTSPTQSANDIRHMSHDASYSCYPEGCSNRQPGNAQKQSCPADLKVTTGDSDWCPTKSTQTARQRILDWRMGLGTCGREAMVLYCHSRHNKANKW